MPLDQLRCPDYPGIPLPELLEVRFIPSIPCLIFVFVYKYHIIVITNLFLLCRWGGREKQLEEQAAKGGAAAVAGA